MNEDKEMQQQNSESPENNEAFNKLVEKAFMVMMAKTLWRNGSIDTETFNTIMRKIDKHCNC